MCLGPYPLWKYVGGVRVCFNPQNVTFFFHSKMLSDNSAGFTSWRMKDFCQKWKVKPFFPGARNSLMAWSDWPRPPLFLRQMYATKHSRLIMMFKIYQQFTDVDFLSRLMLQLLHKATTRASSNIIFVTPMSARCASGCAVCRIFNWEVAGSNFNPGTSHQGLLSLSSLRGR